MIEFKNVSMVYPNGHKALSNVNLDIDEGEFVAIIGLSGAGKSTLIRTINKMIDHTDGDIIVDGENIDQYNKKSLRAYRSKVGMVFQSFNLVERTSVVKNVMVGNIFNKNFISTFLGYYSKKEYLQALNSLDKVGIVDKAYIRADQLSGGQRQRVALARTLCQDPKIILADEPVASLDPIFAAAVMDDFKRINVENNITVLTNMHHVDLALQYATRIIGVKAGEIVYDGPSESVNEEVLEQIYGRTITDEDLMGV